MTPAEPRWAVTLAVIFLLCAGTAPAADAATVGPLVVERQADVAPPTDPPPPEYKPIPNCPAPDAEVCFEVTPVPPEPYLPPADLTTVPVPAPIPPNVVPLTPPPGTGAEPSGGSRIPNSGNPVPEIPAPEPVVPTATVTPTASPTPKRSVEAVVPEPRKTPVPAADSGDPFATGSGGLFLWIAASATIALAGAGVVAALIRRRAAGRTAAD